MLIKAAFASVLDGAPCWERCSLIMIMLCGRVTLSEKMTAIKGHSTRFTDWVVNAGVVTHPHPSPERVQKWTSHSELFCFLSQSNVDETTVPSDQHHGMCCQNDLLIAPRFRDWCGCGSNNSKCAAGGLRLWT